MAVISGTQNSILPVPDGQNQFPFEQGYPVNHIALNNKLIELQNTISSLSNALSLLQTEGAQSGPFSVTVDWPGGDIVTDGDYILMISAPYDFTLTSMIYTVGSVGGNFDFALKNGGLLVGSSNITINQANTQTLSFTTNTSVSQGSRLEFVIANTVGAPTDACVQINATRGASSPTSTTTANAVTDDGDQLITNDGNILVFQVAG